MKKQTIEKSDSKTAIFAAIYRHVAFKDYSFLKAGSDYLAINFLSGIVRFFLKFKKLRKKIKDQSDQLTPGVFEYMLARTAWFDKVFEEAMLNDIEQIVILGAGYDTRALRFSTFNHDVIIYELDAEYTQKRKLKCLKKSSISLPKNLNFVPINFNKQSIQEVLKKYGYENIKRTLFIMEGVSYYLDPESVERTFKNIHEISSNKSLFAFDYTVEINKENINDHYGVKIFYETWKKKRKGEPFKFSIKNIDSFLNNHGFHILDQLDNKNMEKKYLTYKNNSVGKVNGAFRLVLAENNKV